MLTAIQSEPDHRCCLLDDERGTGHEGPCAWLCSYCGGSAKCGICRGDAGLDDCGSCEGCDGTGHCLYCFDGMETDYV